MMLLEEVLKTEVIEEAPASVGRTPRARTKRSKLLIENSVAQRVKRGLGLVDRVKRHGDLYIVAGNASNYTVNLDHGTIGETCTCPDWKTHFDRHGVSRTCKHLVAVTISNARR